MPVDVLQQRLTPAARAKIEKAAQSVVRDVRSNRKLTAKEKRGIEDILGPLVNATSSGTTDLRRAISQVQAFNLGAVIVDGPAPSCSHRCEVDYLRCLEAAGNGGPVGRPNPYECVLVWMRCVVGCRR